MKKAFLILLIVGLCLIFVGGGVFVVGLAAAGWDIKAFSSVRVENNTYTESAESPLTSINVDYEIADITVVVGESESVSVSYPQPINRRGAYTSDISITEEGGRLSIVERSNKRGFMSIWNFSEPKVVVTLPAGRTLDLVLNTDVGDISLNAKDCAFGSVRLESDTGDISLYAVTATSAHVATDTGDISMHDGAIGGKLEIDTDTGDVELKGEISASEISVEVDTGDIDGEDGTLSADKIALATDTGDIDARLSGAQSDYSISVERELGKSNIVSGGSGAKRLSVSTETGDIEIAFAG